MVGEKVRKGAEVKIASWSERRNECGKCGEPIHYVPCDTEGRCENCGQFVHLTPCGKAR